MNFLERLRAWFAREEPAYVRLRCPATKESLATENTEPAHYDPNTGLADYDCHCGERHRFEWGHPVPIYVGDVVHHGSMSMSTEQKPSQHPEQAIFDRCRTFNEIMGGPNPLTPDEIDTLVAKHPGRWGLFRKWGKG